MLGTKSFLILLSLLAASLLFTRGLHAQLIEPTRSLESTQEGEGFLDILSEPPGIDVQLDGKVIGKTPIFSIKLPAGGHVLCIRDSETEIQIAAGKKGSMSWFKGAFIEVPETAKSSGEVSRDAQPQPSMHKADKDRDTWQDTRKDPYYWPLNPRGPMY